MQMQANRFVAALLVTLQILLFAASCSGQEKELKHKLESRVAVVGLSNPDLFGGIVLADPKSKPKFKQVSVLKIETDLEQVQVNARDVNQKPVATQEIAPKQFAILGNGKISIEVFCVDFDKRKFSTHSFTVQVGPEDESQPDDDEDDDVKPGPEVPEDIFDNIGRRVAGWSAGLPDRDRVAAAYSSAAKMLREDVTKTQTDVGKILVADLKAIPAYESSYYKFASKLVADFNKRWPMDAATQADYFDALVEGLK